MEKLYTLEEAQKLLRISRSTINHWLENGTLGSTKIGRRRYILESELNDLIYSNYRKGCKNNY